MIEFGYSCGFWMVWKDGEVVADSGGDWVDRACRAGHVPNGVTVPSVLAVCRLLGPEYEAAWNARVTAQPKPKPRTRREEAAWHRRTLKGLV